MMNWSRLAAVLALGCAAVPAHADTPRPELLPFRAKQVLRKHCLDCHGGPQSRGDWKVLDSAWLRDKGRPFVVPGAPDRSQLLELVEDGSMPPGKLDRVPEADRKVLHDWIAAGAYPFPDDPGEGYVLTKILEDVRKLKEEDRPYARYFSLNHLLAEEETRNRLEAQREALTEAINFLSWEPRKFVPAEIDPGRTIFRADLRALGWDKPPYEGSKLNRFDLALLEYPYGVIADKSPTYVTLLREYLEVAKPVRPLPYVRGDWFTAVATQPPVYFGMPQAGRVPVVPTNFRDDPLRLATAAAELGSGVPEEKLQEAFRSDKLRPLKPLADGGTVSRAVWEKEFGRVVKHLSLGIPIVPLDALSRPNMEPESSAPALKFYTAAPPKKPDEKAVEKAVFKPGEEMIVVVANESGRDVYVELIGTDAKGIKQLLTPDRVVIEAGKEYRFPPAKPIVIRDEVGKEQITLFACASQFLACEVPQLKKPAARVLHRFYQPRLKGDQVELPFDPATVLKKTIEIETVKGP